jgi:hypothetical protein
MRYWGIAATTAVLMLAGAGSARAETRYVSAAGTGDCSEAAPCGLDAVRFVAQDGDVVQLVSPEYPAGGEAEFAARVTVQGTRGARPVVNAAVKLLAPGSVLRDVTVRGHGEVSLTVVGSTVERVDVSDAVGTRTVCEFDGDTTVTDTACHATAATAIALNQWTFPLAAADGHIVLRNVTASSPGPAVSAFTWGKTTSVTVSGSILVGDVLPGDATLTVDHSATSLPGPGNIGATALTLVGGAVPAAGSPTIDAGVPGGGEFDLAGNPRSLGPAPDMGAYEWLPTAPAVVTGDVTAVSQSGAIVPGSVDARGDATSFRVDYGTTAAYGASLGGGAIGAATLARDVSATLTGLAPATTYHYRVVAANAYGETAGEDRAFTTSAAPIAPPPPQIFPLAKPKVTITLAANKKCRPSRSQTVRVKIASGGKISSIEVYVNKKRKLRVTKAKDLKKSIKVSKLPTRSYTLEVKVKTKDGRTVKSSKKYRTCSSSR